MYKHFTRVFVTLSKKVKSSDMFSTATLVNNNLPAASKISLNAFTCHVTTNRYYSNSNEDSDSEFENDTNKNNPSVMVQQKLQQEAQERFELLLSNQPELDKLHKVIELEIEILRQGGIKVPEKVKPTDWLQLIKMKTQTSRRRYLEFLWLNEVKRKAAKKKKQHSLLLNKVHDEKESENSDELAYGLRNNTMFTRIYKSTMSEVLNKKLINAMCFGQKLVIDCGFESHMSYREISSCAKQLMFGFVSNRASRDPFDIHLCNVDPKGELKRRLLSFFPTMDNSGYPFNTTSQSYLELFPKENLVYLTPHTHNIMQKYNPDDVYIIGGIVDKGENKPLTMAKAKEEGLRVAKFPLDNYMDWKAGSGKNLNVNHCIEILIDVKDTNDWEHALNRIVPTRKVIKPFTQHDTTPRVPRTFRNYEPKFQSAQASHVPDLAYYKRVSQKK